jgi:hypothetical protein
MHPNTTQEAAMGARKTVRIGAGQGFYGDTFFPALEIAQRGDVQYISFDALAELTLAILQKDRQKDPALGYTRDLPIFMRYLLPVCREKGIKLITNSGGINPEGAMQKVLSVAKQMGMTGLKVGMVTGDDIHPRLDELRTKGVTFENIDTGEPFDQIKDRALFACAYVGAEPIVEALKQGADVVVTGRVNDAAVFLAPMIHELGWHMRDYDRLAAGTLLGHIMECSAQATGGNWSGDWWNIPMMERMGYPIAEVSEDGSAVLTKAPDTGGRVSFDTVKEQLLYEVHDPRRYMSPDVIADFTSATIADVAKDRVSIRGTRGAAPPKTLKSIIGYQNGWMGQGAMGYTWPDALLKARKADQIIRKQLALVGVAAEEIYTEYIGWNSIHGPTVPEPPQDAPEVFMRIAIRTGTREEAERLWRFIPYLGLNGPPFIGGTTGAARARQLLGTWPTLVPRREVLPKIQVSVKEVT